MRRSAWCLGLGALLFLGSAPSARAQGSAFTCPSSGEGSREKNARAIFDEGVQIEASDPAGALARYECASTLAVRPVIELRIGVVAERLGRLEVAIAAFDRYLELAGSSAPDADSMRQHVKDLRAKRDRDRLERERLEREKAEREKTKAATKLDTTDRSSPERAYAGWALVGVGAVAAVVGTIFLVSAKSQSDEVQDAPIGTRWAGEDGQGKLDSAKSAQTAGIVFFVVAPLALAGGLTLLLTGSSSSTSASALAKRPFELRF